MALIFSAALLSICLRQKSRTALYPPESRYNTQTTVQKYSINWLMNVMVYYRYC
ncbi:hypothetical protein EL79_5036 [Escherichia coli]|nr:hypothetical protein EL79_5036 [Escherichia coli]